MILTGKKEPRLIGALQLVAEGRPWPPQRPKYGANEEETLAKRKPLVARCFLLFVGLRFFLKFFLIFFKAKSYLIVANWWEARFEPLSPILPSLNALMVATNPKAMAPDYSSTTQYHIQPTLCKINEQFDCAFFYSRVFYCSLYSKCYTPFPLFFAEEVASDFVTFCFPIITSFFAFFFIIISIVIP